MQRKIFGFVFTLAMLVQISVATAQTTINWRGGSGSWSLNTNWNSNNVPDSNLENVIIEFAGSGTGTISVDGDFEVRDLTFRDGNVLDILDTRTLTVNNLVMASDGRISGAGNLVVGGSGAHSWSSARMEGIGQTTFSAGTLTIQGLNVPNQVVSRRINTNGVTNWTDGGQALTLSSGAVWNNAGTFTRNQTSESTIRNLDLLDTSIFNNSGTFIKAGSRDSTVNGGTFINSGEVRAESGNVTFTGVFNNNGGDLIAVGSGTITINSNSYVHNGGRLIVDGGGSIGGNAGLTIRNGATPSGEVIFGGVEGTGSINQITTMDAGTYIAASNLSAIDPSNSVGTLSFSGLTMTGGELRIQISGPDPGGTDLINVAGTASMTDITVVTSFLDGFTPTFVGQEFLFFTASNDLRPFISSWSFDQTVFSEIRLSNSFRSASLVSAVPEPSSLALLGLCTGLGLFARKRRVVASL